MKGLSRFWQVRRPLRLRIREWIGFAMNCAFAA